MAHDRDVAAFGERAPGYENGWLGKLHHDIADRTADRRGKARTKLRATRLLAVAGFRSPQWHRLYAVIIPAVTATK